MENNITKEVTVLVVTGNESDIHQVKKLLENTMGLFCQIWHCSDIIRSAGFFKKETPEINIVLLDLSLIDSGRPREVFRQMQDIAGDIPIIVFTEKEDRALALLVIEDGAADNLTRGQFSTDPDKLRDTIEFSLARNKTSRKTEQKNKSDYRLLKEQGLADLKLMKEHGNSELKEACRHAAAILEETLQHGRDDLKSAANHGERNLKEAMADATAEFKKAREQNVERLREKDQVIAWMGGGYSVEKV